MDLATSIVQAAHDLQISHKMKKKFDMELTFRGLHKYIICIIPSSNFLGCFLQVQEWRSTCPRQDFAFFMHVNYIPKYADSASSTMNTRTYRWCLIELIDLRIGLG